MATTYRIQGPDGRVHKIQGPEGATPEQVMGALQAQMQQQGTTQPMQPMSQAQPMQQQSAPQQPDIYTQQAQKQTMGQNLLAGIGGGMKGLYLGAKQLAGQATPEELHEHRRAMEGLRSTGAGTTGEVLGNVAAAIPTAFIPGAGTYAGSVAIGSGLGALQPTTEEGQRGMNVALGAAGGAAGKFLGDKAMQFLRGAKPTPQATPQPGSPRPFAQETSAGLSQSQKNILEQAKKLGFKATPGQATGSKTLTQVEKKFGAQPTTSAPFYEMSAGNQAAMNRSAAKAIGESADSLDTGVLDSAFTRLGNIYKTVGSDKAINVQPDAFVNKLSGIERSVEGVLPSPLANHPLVKGLFDSVASGQPTGKQLRHYASQLGKASNQQMSSPTGNRELGIALTQVKDMADDMLEASLSGKTKALFADARSQYRNLMMLTDRSTGIVNPSTGDVSGAALARRLQSKDKLGFTRGKNTSDMYTAARFYQAFKPVVDVGSDTATKLPANIVEGLLSYPGNMASSAYLSQPFMSMAQMAQTGVAPGVGRVLDPVAARLAVPAGAGLLSTTANQ